MKHAEYLIGNLVSVQDYEKYTKELKLRENLKS
ncbi:hypothetical protein J2S16_003231 [Cytobacillus kochii]|nr:hypothetical protein [Cytobacillus kochii]